MSGPLLPGLPPALQTLRFDSLGALIAGCCTLALEPLLTAWYAWPDGLVLFVGCANLAYGAYSGILALIFRRLDALPRWTVIVLILANGAWAIHCVARAAWLHDTASYLGLGHLLLEGCWVGTLAYLEARIVLPRVDAAA